MSTSSHSLHQSRLPLAVGERVTIVMEQRADAIFDLNGSCVRLGYLNLNYHIKYRHGIVPNLKLEVVSCIIFRLERWFSPLLIVSLLALSQLLSAEIFLLCFSQHLCELGGLDRCRAG